MNTDTPRTDEREVDLSTHIAVEGFFPHREKVTKYVPASISRELERENNALRTAMEDILDRLAFYVSCVPMDKDRYAKTLEGQITQAVMLRARAALKGDTK